MIGKIFIHSYDTYNPVYKWLHQMQRWTHLFFFLSTSSGVAKFGNELNKMRNIWDCPSMTRLQNLEIN